MSKEKLNIYQKLNKVQIKLKAPKGQYNSFGNYKYRSLEDIQEGLKPLLDEYGLIVLLNDKIITVGDRYYVEATATLVDIETGDEISVSASAREGKDKRGMDPSQLTGATSSYARKYAMNGLFAIDDTKDADTMDNREDVNDSPGNSNKASSKQLGFMNKLREEKGISVDEMTKIMRDRFNAKNSGELTSSQASALIDMLWKM